MFCSTIIPTIRRPTVTRAVRSVLDQRFGEAPFEVIIVNDSGEPLPPMDWLHSPRLRVIETQKRERSVARNAGAAIARGEYLHFLDDDDWLFPDALRRLWRLSRESEAAWLYGGYRLVDSYGSQVEDCLPNEEGNCFVRFLAGEWLPLQSSLIRADAFFSIGGFAPLESLLGGNEDVDLARRISHNHDIAGVPGLVAAIRIGEDLSTTNFTNLRQQSRISREQALHLQGAFSRLRASAAARPDDPGYWFGRLLWFYLGSVHWNLQNRRVFAAVSRALTALSCAALAGRHIASRSYWRGATRPHRASGWLRSETVRASHSATGP